MYRPNKIFNSEYTEAIFKLIRFRPPRDKKEAMWLSRQLHEFMRYHFEVTRAY